MTALVLKLRSGVSLHETPDADTTVGTSTHAISLGRPSGAARAALRLLAADGATEDALEAQMIAADGVTGVATWYWYRKQLDDASLLACTLVTRSEPVATLVPVKRGLGLPLRRVDPSASIRLSRFACCRSNGKQLVVETPLSARHVVLHGETGAVALASLTQPRTAAELPSVIAGLSAEAAALLVGLFSAAALLADSDDDDGLGQWELHDLLFHTRSRLGRHDNPFGGTFRFHDIRPPQPALKPTMSGAAIALHRPDLAAVARKDPSLTAVLSARRSIRRYGEPPIDVRELGEFLYRVARVDAMLAVDGTRGRHYEVTRRPYPSGGATYDLELYLTVNRCLGLESGLYHYQPLDHRLYCLAPRNAHVEALLRGAQGAAKMTFEPQVVITLASRFERVSWKYASMAYATVLKNVGVLYQTMYLVATAMRLAPCALGGGDADLFAAAAGTSYYKETSVGEFLLGSYPGASDCEPST
jgi:SagB-type dehydrogenase family enzyme